MDDLGHLPDRQRGALLLRELSGLSHEEIAIAFGTTTAAAKQAIFEARQALVELEQGRAMNCEDVRRQVSEGDRRVLRGRRIGAHLRECSACEAFVLAIPARRAQLLALTPVLPPATAAALLTRSLHAASAQGGASATSAAATAGVAGKAAGTALAWKALAGAAVIVTTAAGVGGVSHLLAHHTAARVALAPRTGHPATVHQASVVTKSRGPATAASSTRRHAAQDPGTFHARRARPSSGHHTSTAALRAATPSDSTTTASNSASPAASASVGGSGSHAGGAHGYQAGGSWHSPSWSAGGGDHTNGWDHGEHGAGHPAYGLTATGQATTAVGQATTAVGKATTAAGQAAAGAGHAAAGAGQAIQGGGVSSRSGWATSQGGGATSQGVITSQDHGPVNQGPQHRTSPPKL